MRVGIGFDTHRFSPGRPLVLGGVTVPYKYGLDGWSDADVLIHAIADAVLGAAAAGDIGRHFPPKDPKWKDSSSLDLLRRVKEIIDAKGYEVVNVDSVLMMEDPKVSEHRGQMCENIGAALGVDQSCVGVKATTTEKLGYVGRGEGASAQAVALLKHRA